MLGHILSTIEEANDEKAEYKSKQKNTTVEVKEDSSKQNNYLKCEMCDYSCKKDNIMKKHINMKHGDTKCKICGKSFPNIKDALMHTANEHSQEINKDMSEENVSGNVQEVHNDNQV